jgi:hypothetical protein
MKTFNLILSMLLLALVPVCWYLMYQQETPQQTERMFILGFIVMLSSATFFGFYSANYWREQYEEAIGLRPKKKPKSVKHASSDEISWD